MSVTMGRVGDRRLAVVVVNYDSADLIRQNIQPLVSRLDDVLAVVVDNFSSDQARTRIARLCESEAWQLVLSSTNSGFGVGMNLGVAAAMRSGADAFLMLNPDATMAPESVTLMTEILAKQPMSVLSPRVLRPDQTVWFEGGALDLQRGRTLSRPVRTESSTTEWPWLSGAALMTSAQAWGVLEGFDEDYFMYWEDVDLSVRAFRSGMDVRVVDAATAIHDEGGTQEASSEDDFSSNYYYYNIRNRLLFAAKILDPVDRRRWWRHSVRESYRILRRGGGRRKILRPWSPIRCAIRANRDGLRPGRASARPRPQI